MTRCLLFVLFSLAAFGAADPIITSRPRILLNDAWPGGGTVLSHLRAIRDANTPEWQQFAYWADTYTYDTAPCGGSAGDSSGCGATYPTTGAAEFPSFNAQMCAIYADVGGTTQGKYCYRAAKMTERYLDYFAKVNKVIDCTNSATPTCTTENPHGLVVNGVIGFVGASGGWAGFNTPIDGCKAGAVQNTSCYLLVESVPTTTTFTLKSVGPGVAERLQVPNTTAFGSYSGQTMYAVGGASTSGQWNQLYWSSNNYRTDFWMTVMVYDFANAFLSVEQERKIRLWFEYGMKWNSLNTENWYGSGTPQAWLANVSLAQLRTSAFIAAALYNASSDAQAAMDAIRDQVVNVIVPAVNSGYGKGYPAVEGTEYGPETTRILFELLLVIRSATGEDLFALVPDMAKDVALHWIYDTSPPKRDASGNLISVTNAYHQSGGVTYSDRLVMPLGDYQSPYDTMPNGYQARIIMLYVRHQLALTGDTTHAAYAQYYLRNTYPVFKPSGSRPGGQAMFDTLYHDQGATATDYRSVLPLAHLTGGVATAGSPVGIGEVQSLSSLTDPDAVLVTSNCGYQGRDHIHGDCGQFQVYRRGRKLSQEDHTYAGIGANTAFHSTVLMGGGHQGNWLLGASEGNGYVSRFENDATGNLYTYWRFEDHRNYRTNQTTSYASDWKRDILHLKINGLDNVLVVADRTAYSQAEQTYWLLQSVNDITIAGNRATLSKENQRLYSWAVLPSGATVRKRDTRKAWITRATHAAAPLLYNDSAHGLGSTGRIRITGCSSNHSTLNGFWSYTKSGSFGFTINSGQVNLSAVTEDFAATQDCYWYVAGYLTAATAEAQAIVTWAGHGVTTSTQIEIANCTGQWAALNGTHTPVAVVSSSQLRLPVNTAGFTDPFPASTCNAARIADRYTTMYRAETVPATAATSQYMLHVLQMADVGDATLSPSAISGTNVSAAQFSTYVVGSLAEGATSGSYDFVPTGGTVKHIHMGADPAQRYIVTATDSDTISIARNAGGAAPTSGGLLVFETSGAGVALSIATTSPLPEATSTVAYSTQLTAIGGTSPYTWSLDSGAFPSGVSIAADGLVSGTPASAGTFNARVCVDDSSAMPQQACRDYVLTVAPPPSTLVITTASPLPSGTVAAPYSATIAAAGGTAPYTFALTTGSLTALNLSLASNGAITGTPAAAGSETITVRVTDANNDTATKVFGITIELPVALATGARTQSTTNAKMQ